jgi:hypothetical protein
LLFLLFIFIAIYLHYFYSFLFNTMSYALIGNTYGTLQETQNAINDNLRNHGYAKCSRNVNLVRKAGYFQCFHKEVGTARVNDSSEVGKKKRNTTTKKTKGPWNWKVKVKYVRDTNQWLVDYIHTQSNHIVRHADSVPQDSVEHFDAPEKDPYVLCGKCNTPGHQHQKYDCQHERQSDEGATNTRCGST